MRTQRITQLDLDLDHLKQDLEQIPDLELSNAYSNYLCGGPWLSSMLWTLGAASGDGFITTYDKAQDAGWTPQAEILPALRKLVEQTFHLDKLSFARLAIVQPGSVIIPHRDLLELENPLHRVHIPLISDENSFFSEDNIVFRMRPGEIWFLDASSIHSVGCFSDRDRVHLLLDFRHDATADEILRVPHELSDAIDGASVFERPPLNQPERDALLSLSELLDERNHRDIVGLVTQHHYRKDGGNNFIWNTLLEIAARAPNQTAADLIRDMHRYFTLERPVGIH